MLNKNSLSKFYYDVYNWSKFEWAWNFNMVISVRAICVTFNSNNCVSQDSVTILLKNVFELVGNGAN